MKISTDKSSNAVIPVAGLGTGFLPATKSIRRKCCHCWIDLVLTTLWLQTGIERIVFVNT